jgi:DnaJ-domain-containing protein 1
VTLVLIELAIAFVLEVFLIALGAPTWTWLVVAALAGVLVFFTSNRDEVTPKTLRPQRADELLEAPSQASSQTNAKPIDQRVEVGDVNLLNGDRKQRRLLSDCLVPIFVEVMRSEGEVSGDHIRSIRNFFIRALSFSHDELEWVRLAMKEALSAPSQDLDFLVLRARNAVRPELRVDLIKAFYEVCLVDGALRAGEREALKKVVENFHLSDEQLQQVTTSLFGDASEHFQVLELLPTATDDEVKAAFRRLAARYHPDTVAGGDAKTIEQYAAQFRRVSEAFEAITRLRGA